MTTDTVAKTAVAQRDGWSVGGMAKGAGMLAPALATMLVVLTTDAVVDGADLDAALRAATARHLRPRRLRRLHVDQRHRRRCSPPAPPASPSTATDLTDAAHRGLRASLARQLVADAEGARPRHRHRGALGAPPSTTRSRSARAGGPQQPVQVRGLRQRPQLGAGARGGRHDPARPSTRPPSTSR